MVRIGTGSFRLSDDHKVYSRVWEPTRPAQAHIAFVHGYGDRCDNYITFFSLLTAAYPIKVHAWDQRGWGKSIKSKTEKGDVGTTAQILDDLNTVLTQIASTIPDISRTPLFIMGHSMGGQESIYYLLSKELTRRRPPIAGLILDAPYIGLDPASHPPWFLVMGLHALACVLPKFKYTLPLEATFISSDKDIQQMYLADQFNISTCSLEGLAGLKTRENHLRKLAESSQPPSHLLSQLPCPVLWAHGTCDFLSSYTASKQLYDRLEPCDANDPDAKVFKSFEGASHNLHAEPGGVKEALIRAIGEWVARVTTKRICQPNILPYQTRITR